MFGIKTTFMRYITILIGLILLNKITTGQTYEVKTGEEIKALKDASIINVIYSDKTGLYAVAKYTETKGFLLGAHYEDKYKLLKFDLNLNLLYEKEYDKVLNGLVVRSIQCLNNQLYLFTHKQLKKENKYIVYGSKLNVMDGSIIGTPAELCAFSFISDLYNEDNYLVKPSFDSTQWLIAGDEKLSGGRSLSLRTFDADLRSIIKTTINIPSTAEYFYLKDVIPLPNKKVFLFGNEFSFDAKKEKITTDRFFAKIYNESGSQEFDIPIPTPRILDFYVFPKKDGQIYLVTLNTNIGEERKIDSLFICKIDPLTGKSEIRAIQIKSEELINAASPNPELKKKNAVLDHGKTYGDFGDYSNVEIRKIFLNETNESLIIVGEKTNLLSYSVLTPKNGSDMIRGLFNLTQEARYEIGNLFVITVPLNGKTEMRVDVIPKHQVEIAGGGLSLKANNYLTVPGGSPFYSSFNSYMMKDKIVFLFNDQKSSNASATKFKDIKVIRDKDNSTSYAISLNLLTGAQDKKELIWSSNNVIPMLRSSFNSNQ